MAGSTPLSGVTQALERVGAAYLAPVFLREVEERQHVVTGGLHYRHSGGELPAQHLGDLLPVGAYLIWRLDYEHRSNGRRHHVLSCFGHVRQQVAQEVQPATLPAAALEHPLHRGRQTQVRIREHQPGAGEASLLEGIQKLPPEALRPRCRLRRHRPPGGSREH